jgi:precorrin-8X/cobalt-precorrin-8 methylmutase
MRVTTLGDLTPDGVTMETILLVGNSRTRIIHGRMVTPRGYGEPKPADAAEPGGRGSRRAVLCDSTFRDVRPDPGRIPAKPGSAGASPSQSPAPTTSAGQEILQESFALIERELGHRPLPPWLFAVVRRMIHASGDFEFADTVRHSPDFAERFRAALAAGVPVITDTEMVLLGVRTVLAGAPGVRLSSHLNDPEAADLAASAGITRSAAGIRLAARHHACPVVAVGNAPTALEEVLRLVDEEGWQPAVVVGIPVGFVGVAEAKSRLLGQGRVPYLTCTGRKGGSAVTAAALNALVEFLRRDLFPG